MTIPKDLVKEAGPNSLTRMHRYNRPSAVLVLQEVMAAFDAHKAETSLGESSSEFRTGNTGGPAHAAIVTR
jgi:hypothetical protein